MASSSGICCPASHLVAVLLWLELWCSRIWVFQSQVVTAARSCPLRAEAQLGTAVKAQRKFSLGLKREESASHEFCGL